MMMTGLENLEVHRKLRVSISYPPLEDGPGVPLLSQNRQFQWFKNPTYIYPMVPASAATLLKEAGFEVTWDDAIAEGKTFEGWLTDLERARPDVVAIETKTPVVKRHWEVIGRIKARGLDTGWAPTVVFFGDHVTALPAESLVSSPVDYVLTGGDYDLLLVNLVRHLSDGGKTPLEPGIWFRDDKGVSSTGTFSLSRDITNLPPIDRDLTRWDLYSTMNGNFKRLPGTYTMAGRDCWWGRCSFCSWTTMYPEYRARTPRSLLDEVGSLIEGYGVREIMDDTGTFPTGGWLRRFCEGMAERGYAKKIFMDCNMRFGALKEGDCELMKRAGFRLLLFGLESANQATLDRLEKGITLDDVTETLARARRAGLYPHITIMFGYPWESREDALETIRFGQKLLKKGLAWTVQATVVVPYPGTPLYEYCREEGCLATEDWDRFDMRGSVITTPYGTEEASAMARRIYSTALSPEFVLRRLFAMRDLDDLRYLVRAGGKVLGHLMDFRSRPGAKGRSMSRQCQP